MADNNYRSWLEGRRTVEIDEQGNEVDRIYEHIVVNAPEQSRGRETREETVARIASELVQEFGTDAVDHALDVLSERSDRGELEIGIDRSSPDDWNQTIGEELPSEPVEPEPSEVSSNQETSSNQQSTLYQPVTGAALQWILNSYPNASGTPYIQYVTQSIIQGISSDSFGHYINLDAQVSSSDSTRKPTYKERKMRESAERKRRREERRELKTASIRRELLMRKSERDERKEVKRYIKRNSPDRRSSIIKYPMGFEYTFMIRRELADKTGHYLSDICQNVKKDILAVALMCNKVEEHDSMSIYSDGYVVEIGSPVHKTWKDMEWWYDLFCETAKKYDLIPWKKKRGGGGAHANIAMPTDWEFASEFMLNLCSDFTNRPYINWVFNDPSDNHTANSAINAGAFNKKTLFLSMSDLRHVFDSKSYSLRFKSKGSMPRPMFYEMRTFDMLRNKRDLFDVVRFISAYLMYIEERTKRGMVTMLDMPRLKRQASTPSPSSPYSSSYSCQNLAHLAPAAEREFMELIDTIGLDRKDYRRFVGRNLRRRIKKPYGETYLV